MRGAGFRISDLNLAGRGQRFPGNSEDRQRPFVAVCDHRKSPALLMETPVAPNPISRVWVTAGGLALKSITESLLSGCTFFGSAGSIFIAPVTNAKLSSRETATLFGGPTTLVGAFTSPITLGG